MGNEGGSYTASVLPTGPGGKLFPLGLASQPFSAIVTVMGRGCKCYAIANLAVTRNSRAGIGYRNRQVTVMGRLP